jgi:adenosylcobinamide-phosphate synthase
MRAMTLDCVLLLAIALDNWLGEPPALLHPVVWIGQSIAALERRAPWGAARSERRFGFLLAFGLPALWALGLALLTRAITRRNQLVGFVVRAWLLKTTFAVRNLGETVRPVEQALVVGDVAASRSAVAMLVSRPVATLSQSQVASAAVESIAESIGDGIVGPWLAYALAGLPGAIGYRVANTLDSMIGYHGRYEHLGRGAARLDDLVNVLPARLAALCVILAARSGANPREAWRVLCADHRRTESPNAGWPMAAMAGALGVVLEKPGHDQLHRGGWLPATSDLARAMTLARRAIWWAAAIALLLRRISRG